MDAAATAAAGTLMTTTSPRAVVFRDTTLFACPACGSDLEVDGAALACTGCRRSFPIEGGIPLLFVDEGDPAADVTDRVKAFYEENPFPNYEDLDSRWTLRDKARRGVLAQLLDNQIRPGAKVLEVGCGTGQLSNFLALRPDRTVFGADICINSLQLGQRFATANAIDNVGFVQMNLFRPIFKPGTFDVVICNGVLHHTADPFGGLRSISTLLKEGGVIMVGLYNRFGRVKTNLRRAVFSLSSGRFTSLDPRLRKADLNEVRRRAWYMDQYKHPHESQHTFGEALRWFDRCGLEFLNSIPKCQPFKKFSAAENLFGRHSRGWPLGRLLVQLKMAVDDREGGFYVVIGRKKTN